MLTSCSAPAQWMRRAVSMMPLRWSVPAVGIASKGHNGEGSMEKVTIESIDNLIPQLRADVQRAFLSLSDDPVLQRLGSIPYPFDSLEGISTIIKEGLAGEAN